jgi:hypothetical protein
MSMVGFPLLLIPVAICNIIVFLMPDLLLSAPTPLFAVTLPSKDVWTVTLNDLLIALSIFLLWLEVIRASRPASKYFTDHFLSLLVFGGAAAEFVMLPKFGNSTFFLLTLAAMVDFFAGISLRARRPRRVAAERASAPVFVPVDPAPVTRIEPVPSSAPTVPAAASVAEAVLLDRPAPTAVAPVIVTPAPEPTPQITHDPSPQIASPGIQPGSGAHRSPDTPSSH